LLRPPAKRIEGWPNAGPKFATASQGTEVQKLADDPNSVVLAKTTVHGNARW